MRIANPASPSRAQWYRLCKWFFPWAILRYGFAEFQRLCGGGVKEPLADRLMDHLLLHAYGCGLFSEPGLLHDSELSGRAIFGPLRLGAARAGALLRTILRCSSARAAFTPFRTTTFMARCRFSAGCWRLPISASSSSIGSGLSVLLSLPFVLAFFLFANLAPAVGSHLRSRARRGFRLFTLP